MHLVIIIFFKETIWEISGTLGASMSSSHNGGAPAELQLVFFFCFQALLDSFAPTRLFVCLFFQRPKYIDRIYCHWHNFRSNMLLVLPNGIPPSYVIHQSLHYVILCNLPPAKWSGLEVSFLRVMSSIPTKWTNMFVLVGGRWLNKLLRPPGLVDTIGRWKNGPT
jgi:hypothetical protein